MQITESKNKYYTPDRMLEILRIVRDAQLNVPKEMLAAPLETLCSICNGIGAEWMTKTARRKITKAFCAAEASAAIHDWMYEHSDGTKTSQAFADRQFRANALSETDYKYSWYNPFKYLAQRKVLAAYDALRAFGRPAWLECYVKNQNLEN